MGLAVLAERRGAVTADVEEGTQCARLVAHEQHRQPADDTSGERAHCRHLIGNSRADPIRLEDLGTLTQVERGIAVRRRRQRLRLSDSGRVGYFSKCHGARLRALEQQLALPHVQQQIVAGHAVPMRSNVIAGPQLVATECPEQGNGASRVPGVMHDAPHRSG